MRGRLRARSVDWWPWSPEALDESRRPEAPVLLSIGHSSCHRCR
ncbi:DUF255 domain-containing protein [Streptomyces thermolilacinus]